jgi:hypothetical protein
LIVGDFWLSLGFALVLLLASAGLMGWHVRTWRCFRQAAQEGQEHDFRRRQFRRRMQSSAMLGLLAIAIFGGYWITSPPLPPLGVLVYWGCTLLLVVWLAMLAVVDAIATRHHYAQLRDACLVEQIRLRAELQRVERARGNGKPPRE